MAKGKHKSKSDNAEWDIEYETIVTHVLSARTGKGVRYIGRDDTGYLFFPGTGKKEPPTAILLGWDDKKDVPQKKGYIPVTFTQQKIKKVTPR